MTNNNDKQGKEEETAQNKTQNTDESSNIGNATKESKSQLIDDANLAAKRLEDANKVKAELLEKEERLLAERALGGRSDAGQAPPEKKEVTPSEYATEVLSGMHNKKKDAKA